MAAVELSSYGNEFPFIYWFLQGRKTMALFKARILQLAKLDKRLPARQDDAKWALKMSDVIVSYTDGINVTTQLDK